MEKVKACLELTCGSDVMIFLMVIISAIIEFVTVLAVLAAQEKVISFGRSQSLFTGHVQDCSTAGL